jgi:DNA repair protein RadC
LDGFAPHETLELLLTLAIPRRDVKQPAKLLLRRFGSLQGVLDAPLSELREVPGIGSVAPVALRIIRESATLYLQQQAESAASLAEPAVLHAFWRSRLGGFPSEVFEAAYLDAGYRLLRDGVERFEEGTVDRAAVYPRRVFEAALPGGGCGRLRAQPPQW